MKTSIIYNDKKHLKKLLEELTDLEKERLLNGKCVLRKISSTQKRGLI
tara:strand:+ start:480 stop:623 length:144 start_codon:yes stop_codon:yes gene_type:complete